MKAQALWLLFVFLACLPGIAAQESRFTQTVSGTVHAVTGQAMPGVQIEIRRILTGQIVARTYSEANGAFEISQVPPGQYAIVAASGLNEAREHVDLPGGNDFVVLSIPSAAQPRNSQNTVSVTQLQIPSKAQKAFHQAWTALNHGQVEEAQRKVDKALAICPTYASALTLRAGIKLQENRAQEASTDGEKAVEADPNFGMGYLVLGTIYNQLARYSDALRVLDRGISLEPKAWQGYFEMSKALFGRGDYRGAIQQADRAWGLSADKFGPILLLRAQARLAMMDYAPAATDLETYLQDHPSSANASQVRETLDQVRARLTASSRK